MTLNGELGTTKSQTGQEQAQLEVSIIVSTGIVEVVSWSIDVDILWDVELTLFIWIGSGGSGCWGRINCGLTTSDKTTIDRTRYATCFPIILNFGRLILNWKGKITVFLIFWIFEDELVGSVHMISTTALKFLDQSLNHAFEVKRSKNTKSSRRNFFNLYLKKISWNLFFRNFYIFSN